MYASKYEKNKEEDLNKSSPIRLRSLNTLTSVFKPADEISSETSSSDNFDQKSLTDFSDERLRDIVTSADENLTEINFSTLIEDVNTLKEIYERWETSYFYIKNMLSQAKENPDLLRAYIHCSINNEKDVLDLKPKNRVDRFLERFCLPKKILSIIIIFFGFIMIFMYICFIYLYYTNIKK